MSLISQSECSQGKNYLARNFLGVESLCCSFTHIYSYLFISSCYQFSLASGRCSAACFHLCFSHCNLQPSQGWYVFEELLTPLLIELIKTAPAASCRWWVIREARVSGQIMGLCQWLQARGHRRQHDMGEWGEKVSGLFLLCSWNRGRLFRGAVIFSVTGQAKRRGRKEGRAWKNRISAGR